MSNLTSKLKLGNLIGQGHFGKVFEGDDPVHGKVAVKRIVRKSDDTDEKWEHRKSGAQKEAQHLKKASHRNVVRVHHYCEDTTEDAILYVMDFCEGGSLQKLYDEGPMDVARLRAVATDVSSGLAALHANEMLHRDIKPGNLLVDARGVTMLGDFGLVTDDLVLGYGSVGDYAYADHIAPEVWSGGPTSVKTDLWAIGMTLYRLLHGKAWHEQTAKPAEVVAKGKYADGLTWLPHVPADWRRTLRKLLRDDPHDRHENALALQKAISGLSTQPAWDCSVSAEEIRWERIKRDRRIIVVWKKANPKKTSWRAWSEPLGAGKPRTLGESTAPVSLKIAGRALKEFFESQS
jgi:serine/threonine-protein kinase